MWIFKYKTTFVSSLEFLCQQVLSSTFYIKFEPTLITTQITYHDSKITLASITAFFCEVCNKMVAVLASETSFQGWIQKACQLVALRWCIRVKECKYDYFSSHLRHQFYLRCDLASMPVVKKWREVFWNKTMKSTTLPIMLSSKNSKSVRDQTSNDNRTSLSYMGQCLTLASPCPHCLLHVSTPFPINPLASIDGNWLLIIYGIKLIPK